MKKAQISVLCGLALLAASPAFAKSGFLEKAGSFLNTQVQTPAASSSLGSQLSSTQIGDGLKQALSLGAKNVVARLSKTGGFNLDPKIHIPLPGPLDKAAGVLKTMGLGSLTTDLDDRMNHAAELAVPKAGALFADAIQKMTLDDARAILNGPPDAATAYLKKTTGTELTKEIQPIISDTLAQAGAVKAYDDVIGKYSQIPFAGSAKTNLNDYVAQKAMDGIFYYVAKEEAAIRENPAKQTTDLLKTVFGAK
jgi:hypothetical protein